MNHFPAGPQVDQRMTLDEAILWMRARPEYADVVRDAYLGSDVADSTRRFSASGEFLAVRTLLGPCLNNAVVLDIGAGTGIASHAFLEAGAAGVIALEPDPSNLVGRGALQRLCADRPVTVLADAAEKISLPDHCVDVVYARQVLHHLRDLDRALRECARVLRPGGVFLACREHVADNERQLRKFLAAHPIHQLAGGEHAFPTQAYRQAIAQAGLQLQREFGPWDTIINAFPFASNEAELASYARYALRKKIGIAELLVSRLPGAEVIIWRWLRRARPGRMHTYLAIKPVI